MSRRSLQLKNIPMKAGVAVVAVGTLVLVASLFFAFQSFKSSQEIKAVLSKYSEALSTGKISQETDYTPKMQDLIQERRRFYEEYFTVGLHSTLESIRSEFIFGPDTVGSKAEVSVISKDQLSVQVVENVILQGRCTTPPEEHPLVLAGHWALSRTQDERVKQEGEKYIQSVMEEAKRCMEDGFETTLFVHHSLVVARTSTGLQIRQDSFTDQDQVFSGIDHVTWVDGQYVRNRPDFTAMPDYQRYTMPTEELGKELLDRFTREYSQ